MHDCKYDQCDDALVENSRKRRSSSCKLAPHHIKDEQFTRFTSNRQADVAYLFTFPGQAIPIILGQPSIVMHTTK